MCIYVCIVVPYVARNKFATVVSHYGPLKKKTKKKKRNSLPPPPVHPPFCVLAQFYIDERLRSTSTSNFQISKLTVHEIPLQFLGFFSISCTITSSPSINST